MRRATFPVNRSQYECDILLSPTERLRPACNVPRECKIIRTNGVESLWMRRSNGAMQPSDISVTCRYTFQNKSDFRRDASIFHSDWRNKSYACHVSQCSAVQWSQCSAVQSVQCSAVQSVQSVQCSAVQSVQSVQCSAVQSVQCSAVQCSQCSAVQLVQCSAVQCSQCSAVQCSAVQSVQSAVETPSCHTTTAIQTHSTIKLN